MGSPGGTLGSGDRLGQNREGQRLLSPSDCCCSGRWLTWRTAQGLRRHRWAPPLPTQRPLPLSLCPAPLWTRPKSRSPLLPRHLPTCPEFLPQQCLSIPPWLRAGPGTQSRAGSFRVKPTLPTRQSQLDADCVISPDELPRESASRDRRKAGGYQGLREQGEELVVSRAESQLGRMRELWR